MKVARQHKAEAGKRRKVSAKGLQGGLQRVTAGYGGLRRVMVTVTVTFWFGLLSSHFEPCFIFDFGLIPLAFSLRLLFRLLTFAFVRNVCQRFSASLFCSLFFLSIAFRSQIKYFHAGISFWDLRSGLLQNSCASNIQHMMQEFKRISDSANRFSHFL